VPTRANTPLELTENNDTICTTHRTACKRVLTVIVVTQSSTKYDKTVFSVLVRTRENAEVSTNRTHYGNVDICRYGTHVIGITHKEGRVSDAHVHCVPKQ